jgi:hypothetical protein
MAAQPTGAPMTLSLLVTTSVPKRPGACDGRGRVRGVVVSLGAVGSRRPVGMLPKASVAGSEPCLPQPRYKWCLLRPVLTGRG